MFQNDLSQYTNLYLFHQIWVSMYLKSELEMCLAMDYEVKCRHTKYIVLWKALGERNVRTWISTEVCIVLFSKQKKIFKTDKTFIFSLNTYCRVLQVTVSVCREWVEMALELRNFNYQICFQLCVFFSKINIWMVKLYTVLYHLKAC